MSLLARANVAGDDHRERAGEQQRGGNRLNPASISKPAMPASVPSSVNVRMPPSRASGPVAWPGSLALDADGGAAEDRDDQAGKSAEIKVHRRSILPRWPHAGYRSSVDPDLSSRPRYRSSPTFSRKQNRLANAAGHTTAPSPPR